jgi:hypothetical protein
VVDNKLECALALATNGFKVFPIAPGAKFPPLLNGWPQKATSNLETVAMYWLPQPAANIGIHCEGLLVIDVDVKKGGNESIEFLRIAHDLPATLISRTPTGGSHHFYRLPYDHPGVPNSVEELGKGLDVRSTGGYVVAPGSEVAAGMYVFEGGAAIVDAPGWLFERLGKCHAKQDGVASVPDAPATVIDRAREFLRGAERSVKGQGGDQAAYRVACSLRDLGVSYGQACELMRSEAWDHGCGWRDGWLEEKPIRSAYRYATGEPGSKAALPEDFPIVETSTVSAPRKARGRALTLTEFANQESRGHGYVVKGLLQRRSYAEVFGAPGEGKTFVALDLAYHVAAGKPWVDRKVHAGPVLYLAYEGTGGMVKRAQALRQKYGDADVPLYIAGAAFNLREKAGRQDLAAVIAELPAKPVLIVIDTFARALMGGDENSAQDVGAFNSAIAALIESTNACVLIVHHSGKDKSKGARGSSALLGAIDTEIEIDSGRVLARKQRDVEVSAPIGFKLVPVVVGVDEDGDELTSCVVEPTAVAAANSLERVSGNAKRGFDVLCQLRPDNKPVDMVTWRTACVEFLGTKNTAQRFYDIKKILLAKNYIVAEGDCFKRRLE